MDVCKKKQRNRFLEAQIAKPASMKDEDAEQDDDILKHYTKEARDKERSVDIKTQESSEKKRKLEELKEAQGEKTILEER
jgi:divalent metal cation (Fe/Co/Zn/Cd) transporter